MSVFWGGWPGYVVVVDFFCLFTAFSFLLCTGSSSSLPTHSRAHLLLPFLDTLMIKVPEKDGQAGLDKVDAFVKGLFPSASLLNVPIAGCSKYEVDRKDVVLSRDFGKILNAKTELNMDAWSFTESTLEEVFLKLAALTECFSGGHSMSKGESGKNVLPLAQTKPLADMVAEIDADADTN